MNIKIPKIVYAIPIVILAAIIITFALDGTHIEPSPSPTLNSDLSPRELDSSFSNKLYSGPFAILDSTYGVDDTVFLIGTGIPLDSSGDILFIRPDGKIHHQIQFNGAKSAINHYFTPVSSSDLKECPTCKFFGTWKISFRSDEGISYAPITFEVIDSRP